MDVLFTVDTLNTLVEGSTWTEKDCFISASKGWICDNEFSRHSYSKGSSNFNLFRASVPQSYKWNVQVMDFTFLQYKRTCQSLSYQYIKAAIFGHLTVIFLGSEMKYGKKDLTW